MHAQLDLIAVRHAHALSYDSLWNLVCMCFLSARLPYTAPTYSDSHPPLSPPLLPTFSLPSLPVARDTTSLRPCLSAEQNVEMARKALASAMKDWSDAQSRPVIEV